MNYLRIKKILIRKINSVMEKAMMTEHTFMVVVALIIGILAGFGAIFIRAMITGPFNQYNRNTVAADRDSACDRGPRCGAYYLFFCQGSKGSRCS